MKAKPIRISVLILVIFFLLSLCVSAFYAATRYNSEKLIQYISTADRSTSFYYKAENENFLENFFTINNQNCKSYITTN